ncbi:MAG: response regulator [Spirochaetales bacterium]|nr:response regulator [Spirochaetales bacterium]
MDNYKILIVDDEYLIRELIKRSIDWNKLNCIIVGEASSSIEGLKKVDEYNPDIIISDVCMPIMNGLEFSRIVLSKHPHINIVLLSGHDEFKYVQSALSIGVKEYLLKPLNSQQVINSIEKLKNNINKARKTLLDLQQLELYKNEAYYNNESSNLVCNIKKYIEKNISDPNLTLVSIANEFGMNHSYLSRKFSQESNFTIVEFISKCRVNLAKKLILTTDLRSYEICDQIGISDPHYFSLFFKKHTGVSITEFKKSIKVKN